MSETTTETSTESSAALPSQTNVETAQSTEGAQTAAQTPEEKATAEAAIESAKHEKTQKRIDKAVRSQREAERVAEAARAENEKLRQQLAAKDPEQARIQLEEAEINRRAEAKAQQMLAQRDAQSKISAFDANGAQELGSVDEWNDACNTVASFGATKRPDFVPILSDIEDGHRAIPLLAADPDLTDRILAMPPHKMAIELSKLAAKPIEKTAKKQISNAPPPVRPVSGANKGDGWRPNMTVAEHMAWVQKTEADKSK